MGGLVGLLGGVETARTLPPWSREDRRDAVMGWGVVAGLIALLGLVALADGI